MFKNVMVLQRRKGIWTHFIEVAIDEGTYKRIQNISRVEFTSGGIMIGEVLILRRKR